MPTVSFEFFPPKSVEASFRLRDCVRMLAPLDPTFVSVTYGAGGTTRAITQEAVTALQRTSGLRVAAHLTCVNASRDETRGIAQAYAKAGVTDIVALRGDPPKGQTFQAHPDGFASSVDLVADLAAQGDFNITVGAYPESHADAANMQANIDHLKAKFDAGATQAITQFFFEADTFLRFRDACAAAGITAPIHPGILPIESWDGVQKFAKVCGTHIPQVLHDAFNKATRDGCTDLLATAVAAELCDDLLSEGVDHLHFFTLNKPELTYDTCRALGIQQANDLERVA